MATNRQITANRKNAQKSTGPRSSVGKSATKRNALAHGLRAAEILLPDEDESVFRQFQQELFDHFMPANALESEFAERIVGYLWRLRRCRRIESGLLGGGAQVMELILQAGRQSYIDDLIAKTDTSRPVNELSEAEFLRSIMVRRLEEPTGCIQTGHLIDNLPNQDLIDLFVEADKREKQQNPLTYSISLGLSESISENDMLSKLARYKAGLDRALYRCLHELQRLQAIRMNQPASAPPTLDLNVTIENS
jgi:hypothetical protein